MKNILKEKIKNNKVVIGSWVSLAHPVIVEIMAKSGFDWLAIDMEHSAITLQSLEPLIQIIEANGVVPLVRLSSNDPILAKRVMDIGAYGVIVPMINSRAEAEVAVKSIKYPPIGMRGVGLYRAQNFGSEFEEYKNTSDQESMVIVQIEHKDGVENIEEILKVPGVDGVFVGPYDLSCSLGVSGQLEHSLMNECKSKIIGATKKSGLALGIHVVAPSLEEVKKRIEEGYNFIAYSTDAIVLNNHFREFIKNIKK